MLHLVTWFILPKRYPDIELTIPHIYEGIAFCLQEYTMGEVAQSHQTALTKSRCRKVQLDVQ